jgi:Dolichyl-phosphate-mannose-protein mannosyltransferase
VIERKKNPWLWVLPLLAGLALRLFFVFHFTTVTGDGPVYEDIANNWWVHHVFGIVSDGKLIPVDIRMPGYPALLLLMSHLFRRGETALMLAQVLLDLGTCVMVAVLAGRLVPVLADPVVTETNRSRIRVVAIWIAALCPFLANYCGVTLTEVPATFCIAAALLAFSTAFDAKGPRARGAWFWGGFATAMGTLFRPETPLLLVALALVCIWRWRRRIDWPRLVRAGVLTLCGLVIPLTPWAVRNAVTLHEFRILAARYANEPGDFVPIGFFAWTKTWITRYHYSYTIIWKMTEDVIPLDEFPNDAFDNENERQRVYALINSYNLNCCDAPFPGWDAQFAELARERTARHPLRTYVRVPLERALAFWFTPRIELLPYSGELWPPGEKHADDPVDFDSTIALWVIGVLYSGAALAGLIKYLWYARMRGTSVQDYQVWVIAFFAMYCIVRTFYLTQVETTEPRYVLECFPVIFIFAALLWIPRRYFSSTGSG